MSYFICGSKPLSELTRIYFGEEYHDDDNMNMTYIDERRQDLNLCIPFYFYI